MLKTTRPDPCLKVASYSVGCLHPISCSPFRRASNDSLRGKMRRSEVVDLPDNKNGTSTLLYEFHRDTA